jgi:hypothetical protein
MAANLLDLQRKLEKKIDQRKTIQLSPDELDLMVECGAYDQLVRAALEFRKAEVRMRRVPTSEGE